jgi:hypothetical protein
MWCVPAHDEYQFVSVDTHTCHDECLVCVGVPLLATQSQLTEKRKLPEGDPTRGKRLAHNCAPLLRVRNGVFLCYMSTEDVPSMRDRLKCAAVCAPSVSRVFWLR